MSSIGALVRLTALIPPPDYPIRANGDWKRFTSVNGFAPPEDYRMLIREYGAGTFTGCLALIEPFHPSLTFRELVEREARAFGGGGLAWPNPGGLLPWAKTARGDLVGWQTVGRPDHWRTTVWEQDGTTSSFDLTAIEFVLGVIEARANNGASKPTFEPAAW